MTTTVLLSLLAAALAGAAAYFVGLRTGERLGRRQTRSDVEAIARTAADQSNRQAREAYEHATGQAVDRLEAAARSDRELGRAQFAETAAPLRESLTEVRRLASELEEKRARDHGALEQVARNLSEQVQSVLGSSRSLREALKGDRQARGRWGEIQLQTLVESVGLTAHSDFTTQTGTNGVRPDLVLRLPGGALLPVDAKAPMDDYLTAAEVESPELQDAALAKHAKQVKLHADALAKRNYPAKLGDGPPSPSCSSRSSRCSRRPSATSPTSSSTRRTGGWCSPPPTRSWGCLWSVAAMWRERDQHPECGGDAERRARTGEAAGHLPRPFRGRRQPASQGHRRLQPRRRLVGIPPHPAAPETPRTGRPPRGDLRRPAPRPRRDRPAPPSPRGSGHPAGTDPPLLMYARPRLALPVPRSPETARQLAEECRRLITTRVRLRSDLPGRIRNRPSPTRHRRPGTADLQVGIGTLHGSEDDRANPTALPHGANGVAVFGAHPRQHARMTLIALLLALLAATTTSAGFYFASLPLEQGAHPSPRLPGQHRAGPHPENSSTSSLRSPRR